MCHPPAKDDWRIPITLKMPEQGPAQKPYASHNRKPLNCMAQEFSTSGAHKQMILEHVATRGQNVRHLRYTPAGSVVRVSDARNKRNPPAGYT